MKKLIAVLLTFTMLFTMFTSFSIVTTHAATTHEVDKIVWTQTFEKNMAADNPSSKWEGSTSPYFKGGRFTSASSGSARFDDGVNNNRLVVFPSNVKDAAQDSAVKVYLDNTVFEVGKKYKVSAEVEVDLSSKAEEGETRNVYAYILSNTGMAAIGSTQGATIPYLDGGKGVVTTKVFEYTQDMKNVANTIDEENSTSQNTYYHSLNLRVQAAMYGKVDGDKDRFYIDNVRIIEVTDTEDVIPEGEGSVFEDYVLGSVMDFEDLSYNTLRHSTSTTGRDTDSNGIKYIVDDPTGADNKVFRGPYVLDKTGNNNSARTELIGLLANANNTAGKTYTISFKMYPYGYSNVPITVGLKHNVGVTSYGGMATPTNLVEGTDFVPNQWNSIQFDITTAHDDEINFSMHQRSLNNGASMDFDKYDYYQYIYLDDIKVTEKVNPETYFTDADIYNEENWSTDSEDIFTVGADKIEVASSENAEELSLTFDGVQGSSMMITYDASLIEDEIEVLADTLDILPYISVCTENGDELAISKLDNSTVNGTLIFNVPEDENNPGQYTDLTLNIVAGTTAAEITDFTLVSVGAPYEVSAQSTDDAKIKVTADFDNLPIDSSEFTAVALTEGETVTNFTKDMIDSYPSGTANGAAQMEIEIDMVDVDEYKSTFSVILYNEENSIYLNVGDVEYINPNFAYTVLGYIQAAGDAEEVKNVIETVDAENDIVYKNVLEINTIDFVENTADDDDLEIIYNHIYENKANIINGQNTSDLTLLHNVIKKAIPVALVKNGHGVQSFKEYVSENGALLGIGAYTKYVTDNDTYSDDLFGTFLADIAADETITTFEEIMEAIEAAMNETPGDLDVYVFFHDMENGDFSNLVNNVDYELGGEGEREFGVVKASDEGITDPYGNPDGHLFKLHSTSSARIKFTDIFNPKGVTPRDLGSKYEISFDLYRASGSPLIRLFSVKDFNANGSIGSAKSSKFATGGGPAISVSGTEEGEWSHVTYTYTLDNLMLTSLGIERGTSYFDNIKVKRIEDNRRVLDSADLQPLDNDAALTLDGVTETADGFVFTEGGTLKYGVGTAEKQGQKYVAKNGGLYVVTMVVKTNSENALTLTANSSQVQRSSTQLEDASTYPNLTTYPVADVDDFILEAGNANDVIIVSGSSLAQDGVTMVNTNGEFKSVTFIYKDTGAKGVINYLGKEMEILRSINITSNEEGAVVKSMKIKEYDPSSPIENGDFEAEFEGWGDVDTDAFATAGGQLVITGSTENEGKQISQVVLMPVGEGQIKYTNVDNGTSDAYIEIADANGNVIAKSKISPVEAANTDKVVPFVVPGEAGETAPVIVKVVAGSDGNITIDNFEIITAEDPDYIDLSQYPSFTGYFTGLKSNEKLEILDSIFDTDFITGTDYVEAICDAVIDSRIENANKNYSTIVDVLAENADYLGLTNWSKVTDVSNKSYYSDVKEGIAKYVLNNGYATLNDEIEDIIDDAKDSGGSSGNGGGTRPSIPQNITNTTTPVAPQLPDVNFTDIDSVEWAKDSIITLAQKGVVSGYEDGTFKPNNEITRAEFAKMLVTAFEVYDDNASCDLFNDVSTFDWHYKYVATLAKLGVTNGLGNGSFGAADKITRQDMVVLIVRMTQLLGKPINATTAEVTFNDNDDIASYAIDAVKVLQKAQIVSGFEDGTFKPGATATRAQVAKILCALIG
ncbi:MAG: S-layer homology domain-containing protein [Ruminococcaceae bacterium]|nr:S-layer homology domain-containing protein [Oscillospiraceae bacterium]